jgi:hypothetical protein
MELTKKGKGVYSQIIDIFAEEYHFDDIEVDLILDKIVNNRALIKDIWKYKGRLKHE